MISVIILARDKSQLSRACLNALAHCSSVDHLEVIFVDNDSRDDTPSLANEYRGRFPRFYYLRNNSNLSFSLANNRAAQAARGDTLLFLNNDVVAGRGAIERMAAALDADPAAGVAGARLVFPGGETIQHAGIVQTLWGYPSNYGQGGRAGDPRFNQPRAIFAVTGAMMLIRRELFQRIGGFDERYVWGYEDVDLCLKTRAAGSTVIYVPSALSEHWESATLKETRDERVVDENFNLYHAAWAGALGAAEERLIAQLRAMPVTRPIIFGAGRAARGLTQRLIRAGIEPVGFIVSADPPRPAVFMGKPVVSLAALDRRAFDRLLIGTQFYFEIEPALEAAGLRDAVFFPVMFE
ncbi:MAG: glycosyltransferase [Nitrospinae bacterium]|nr:glycosyltransferase [Nitrospinota bacterium]